MLVYRVCVQAEAEAQREGEPYHLPSTQKIVFSQNPGFHATKTPEFWRRILNYHMRENGLYQRYLYTLLLEIPDDTPEVDTEHWKIMPGCEYRLADTSQVIVRGIAGPEWPLPAWVPQPEHEKDWQPDCVGKTTLKSAKWQPRQEAEKGL
ncbi:hypothetical protein KDA_76740 [Dictyobacter alpinus]|uniref:Uncharacterized protein n=1 Tax=Dictyobacter alpinus TaxID=2014873 RepID=A0A402BLK8_9CHLR|nr:hypothetical protein [Dictyobacter alpinus]GCE32190.1 hypothetical protein KDA_76740 [Dictyobacter alpinus]